MRSESLICLVLLAAAAALSACGAGSQARPAAAASAPAAAEQGEVEATSPAAARPDYSMPGDGDEDPAWMGDDGGWLVSDARGSASTEEGASEGEVIEAEPVAGEETAPEELEVVH